jgi:hypothetical protein
MAVAMLPGAHLYIQVLGNATPLRLRWFPPQIFPEKFAAVCKLMFPQET